MTKKLYKVFAQNEFDIERRSKGIATTMVSNEDYFEISDDEIRAWIEQEATVHIIAKDAHGDPVELNRDDLVTLIASLERLLSRLEGQVAMPLGDHE